MRLLNALTLEFESFPDERTTPPYAILSHTWSRREVLYADLLDRKLSETEDDLDWQKVYRTCRQALADSLDYAWIDTCCINKDSSAELSEAINSMFRWYQKARVCYAYLADVVSPSAAVDDEDDATPFAKSRWFTRGWTLQELIAPNLVVFFDRSWRCLGEKSNLREDVNQATGIDTSILIHKRPIYDVSIAERMSWAAQRETTRIEDSAYCLLGLFDVSMPMLYGEGEKAFARLQEEILKVSADQSIFAWTGQARQMLAHSPANFIKASSIVSIDNAVGSQAYGLTNRGLQIALQCGTTEIDGEEKRLAILDCVDLNKPYARLALAIQKTAKNDESIEVVLDKRHDIIYIDGRLHVWAHVAPRQQLLFLRQDHSRSALPPGAVPVQLLVWRSLLRISSHVYPSESWDLQTNATALQLESALQRRHDSFQTTFHESQRRVVHLQDAPYENALIIFGCWGDLSDISAQVMPFLDVQILNQGVLSQSEISQRIEEALCSSERDGAPSPTCEIFDKLPAVKRVNWSGVLQIKLTIQEASVGLDGNGWALTVSFESRMRVKG